MKIYGITCKLRTPAARKALRAVLSQIRIRRPADFARIKRNVGMIAPLAKRETANGTGGRWCEGAKMIDPDDPATWAGDEHEPGVVRIAEVQENAMNLQAIIAHELGHACATYKDLIARNFPFDEWNSELTADWYAYRWGFGRAIARHRRTRHVMHHGPAPGTEFEYGGFNYRFTRNFRCHQITS